MTAIKIDPNMCNVLRAELDAAFEQIKKKLGSHLKLGALHMPMMVQRQA